MPESAWRGRKRHGEASSGVRAGSAGWGAMRSSNAVNAALIAPASLVARIGTVFVAESPVLMTMNAFMSSVSPRGLQIQRRGAAPQSVQPHRER